MTARLPTSVAELPDGLTVPEDALAVFISGSLVVGWGNPTSDVDVYVVTEQPATIEATTQLAAAASGGDVGVLVLQDDAGARWDAEYWTRAQIDALLARVQVADASVDATAGALSYAEADVLYRISVARALLGADWLVATQRAIDASALGRILAGRELWEADGLLEDAAGMLAADDVRSAVLAARLAFGRVVDAYLFSQGLYAPNVKWRYRKIQALADQGKDTVLDVETYWAVETMRELDPADPTTWVQDTLDRCQEIIMQIDFAAPEES